MKYQPEVWKRDYQENGFVIVQDLLAPSTLSVLRNNLKRIIENPESLPTQLKSKLFLERDHVKNNPQWYAGILTPEDCGNSVRQIADLPLFDTAFAELICHPHLLDVLEALFESPEFTFHSLTGRPKAARVGNGISNGNFHRDTPFENFTFTNTILAILCLNDMTGENGATAFIRGSHKVSDEEAKKPYWREVEEGKLNLEDKAVANCPAGSAVFFNSKILHAAGHNRSEHPRQTLLFEWGGPNVLPTSPERFAHQGLRPRSQEPAFVKQIRMTFPDLFSGKMWSANADQTRSSPA